jgi:hypothetical protein
MRTGLLILATIACLQGCADDRPPAPPGDGPDTRQAAGLETVPGETGRRHRVARIAKREATRVDEHTIRNRWGIPLALVREDEAHYYYKEYVPVAAPEPTVSTHAGVATSYRTDVPESARLRLDAFGEGLPTHGQWRDGFALADLDGDGHLDLVHGPARGSSAPPVIFLGDGAGRWRPWLAASFPPGTYAYGDAAAGDLDGDGHADVVLAMHVRGLAAFLGDGRGGFRRADHGLDLPDDEGHASFSSRRVRLVDWDRDGHLDILALGEGPRLAAAPARGPAVDRASSACRRRPAAKSWVSASS